MSEAPNADIAARGRAIPVRVPQPQLDVDYLEDGSCTLNAGLIADDFGWRYAEGYAKAPDMGGWTPHAWCVDEAGLVIDPTWRDTDERFVYVEAHDPFNREADAYHTPSVRDQES